MGTHFSHRMLGTVIKGGKRLFIFRAQHEDAVLSPYAGDGNKGQPTHVYFPTQKVENTSSITSPVALSPVSS